jgi:hypothetical protein
VDRGVFLPYSFSKLLGQDLAAISVRPMVSAVVVIERGVDRFRLP